MTHTYAILDVSPTTFDEIRAKLDAAGYQHAFDRDVIDMHGIALRAESIDIAEHASDCNKRNGQACDCGREEK